MLTVLRAVITRWTAHYLSIHHLLEICPDLTILTIEDKARHQSEDKSQLITGKAEAKAKAEAMIKLIQSPLFWHAITR